MSVENTNATPLPAKVEVLASVPNLPVPDNAEATTVLITLPPGSPGNPPHRHTALGWGMW